MDADLVTRAQRGDQGAFANIASAIGPRFHGVAFGILRDRELAEEVTQQAIVDCWRDLPQLRDPSRFDGWAYRLVVNACYSEARRARRWIPNLAPGSQVDHTSADALAAVIDRDELERGFRRLSLEHRTILVLHYYLDLATDDIAVALSIPVGTAKSRLHRAVSAMRAALAADARAIDQRDDEPPREVQR